MGLEYVWVGWGNCAMGSKRDCKQLLTCVEKSKTNRGHRWDFSESGSKLKKLSFLEILLTGYLILKNVAFGVCPGLSGTELEEMR